MDKSILTSNVQIQKQPWNTGYLAKYKVTDKEDKDMFEFEALIKSIKKYLGKHKDVNLMPSKF